MNRIPNRILVVKTHAMGDVLMTTPAIRALRQQFPKSRIHYLTSNSAAEMIKDNPNVDRVIRIPDSLFFQHKLFSIGRLLWQLRMNRYDLLILFQPNKWMQQVFRCIRPRAYAGLSSSVTPSFLDYSAPWRMDREKYVADDFLSLIRMLGTDSLDTRIEFFINEQDRKRAIDLLGSQNLDSTRLVILAPGGGMNPRDQVFQKLWSVERYMELTIKLKEKGFQILAVGSEADRERVAPLLTHNCVVDLLGKTSVGMLAMLMTLARVTITNDSMPAHLAISQTAPVVILFGPTRWKALLPEEGRFVAVFSKVDCAPCYDNEPFPGCSKRDCIDAISVNDVWEAVKVMLKI